uniref:TmcB/TmcC TPR repeats domain-containing protein n=1 Tax=Noccaea caerulescens TaxID=107243 RepID=A0A1J3GH77_NOCCA
MKALLMRTGSMPVQNRFIPCGGSSRKVTPTISRHNSVESLPGYGEGFAGGKISIEVKAKVGMRRVLSESDVIRSERMVKSVGSKPSPAKIPEGDEAEEDSEIRFSDGWGSLVWKESGSIPVEEEQGFSGCGGGGGSGYSGGKGNGNGGYDDRSKIGDYYREMLKSNPNNSLLLMNYGKFLYEVEKDSEKAEEYYGRAILENPGDGEALSMYGKLIWETKRDEERAQGYFDQAVHASPDDCMVLGSYAHFMWEAEDDEEEEEEEEMMAASPAMVSAV